MFPIFTGIKVAVRPTLNPFPCLPGIVFRLSIKTQTKNFTLGFPGGTVVKNSPANSGDMGSSPGPERTHMLRVTKPMRHNY